MKTLLCIISLMICFNTSYSQTDTSTIADTSLYRIIKTDGGEILGQILTSDAREILVKTIDGRTIYIPQYVIKEIIKIDRKDFNESGQFVGEDRFATRFFLTTNGLPIKKGEHYVQWNIFGPDFQFSLGNDIGVGIMTSWIGMPMIGSVKKSYQLGNKTQLALGALVGTGSWAAPDWGGVLPFSTISFGNRRSIIAFSGGYGAIWIDEEVSGRALASVAAMTKVSAKISLVFDSFIIFRGRTTFETYSYGTYSETYANEHPGFALFILGLRWHKKEGSAFQFGFTGLYADGYMVPVPIPMVQWYQSINNN